MADFFSHIFFTVTLYLLHLSFVCTSCLIVLYVRINTEYISAVRNTTNESNTCTGSLHTLSNIELVQLIGDHEML